MSDAQSWKNLKFEAPASYRIRVQGHLDDSWSDRLGGMVITRAFTADKQPMTILNIPANVPARDFWSVVVNDPQSGGNNKWLAYSIILGDFP